MSFIDDYQIYTSRSESPINFNLFTAYGVVSALLGGRVWTEVNSEMVLNPNLYILYVAPPGSRKSTAMKMGRKLIRESVGKIQVRGNKVDKTPIIPLSASATSSTQFIKNLAQTERTINMTPTRTICPMLVCASELSSFLMVSPDILGVLTDLWDEPEFEYNTGNAGQVIVPGPYLTIMGCATPDWITSQLKTDIISGGFSRRVLFIYETTYERKSLRTKYDTQLYTKLKDTAKAIAKLRGPMEWEPETMDWFDEWYQDKTRDLKLADDKSTMGYANSKHDLVVKLATCVAAANLDMTIRLPYIKTALRHLEIVEPNIPKVFSGIGRNPTAPLIESMVEYIESTDPTKQKMGWVSEGELIRKFMKDFQRVEIVDTIHQLCKAERLMRHETTEEKIIWNERQSVPATIYSTPQWFTWYLEQKQLPCPPDNLPAITSRRH